MESGLAQNRALQVRIAELERELALLNAKSELVFQEAQARAELAHSVLRTTEKRFGSLFDSNVIGILEINHERVLDANDSFLAMTGQTREAVLSGSIFWRQVTPARYHRMDEQACERAIAQGSFPPFEKEFLRKDGSVLPAWVGGVLLSPPPEWTCMAFVLDLSERKALEEQSRTAQKLKTLGLLSGIIAHDFNNLLTTIIANASLSLDLLHANHPAHQAIQEVIRASDLASGLTEQLVNYSSKSRGGNSQAIEISKLVLEIGELIELPISKKATLEWNLAPNLPLVLGDGLLVQQIVMNLITNAADSLGEKAGTIRISTECRDYSQAQLEAMSSCGSNLPGGTYVAVEIQDNGCGMDESVKARIFDPLFTTKAKGRGLGLASALGIVRSHRGALDVRTKLGEGTTFTIVFPIDTEISLMPLKEKPKPKSQGSGTVLFVDDELSVRRLAEASLTRYGYRVMLAADGRECLEIFEREGETISLIVMDLSMPVVSGREAFEQLISLPNRPKILLSSGYSDGKVMKGLEGLPFLRKPYTSSELAQKVKDLHSA